MLQTRPAPTQFTKDARWLVVIVVLALVMQRGGATWSTGFTHAGLEWTIRSEPWGGWTLLTLVFAIGGFVVAVARRGADRFDEHTVMGLALAGVIGTTALVWLLIPVEQTWVQWAVMRGDDHPFVIGNVSVISRYADYLG